MFDSAHVVIAVGGAAVWLYLRITRKDPWDELKDKTLTLQAYIEKYPHCATGRGIRCAACGATSIKNWGFEGAADTRRIFLCNHCNTRLYWAES